MQPQEDKYILIASMLIQLKNSKSYKVVQKGFFKNKPELRGFIIDLSKILKSQLFFILDITSNSSNVKNINDNIFITYGNTEVKSIEEFTSNLEAFSKGILKLLTQTLEIHGKDTEDNVKSDKIKNEFSKYGLPYGYSQVKGDNGEPEIVIDKEEANMALTVFRTYLRVRSIRKANQIIRGSGYKARSGERVDVAIVSGILHDKRYLKMKQQIIPASVFYKAQDILRRNSKQDNLIRRF